MTAPAQRAREALGARLREIRKDASLTGRALADSAGWQLSKVSKIEHGKQSPSEDDLKVWCRICQAEDQIPDLISTVRSIEAMYMEWRRALRTGMKRGQEVRNPLYERTKLFRIYEPGLIPGLLQTAEYATAVMSAFIAFNEIPDDLDTAVAVRVERQRVLYHGDRRFLIVIEEQALRTHIGDVAVMAGQLDRLVTVMSLQRLSLGIVPSAGKRHMWPSEGFWMFDEHTVQVETVSAELNIEQPREIAVYAKRFGLLQRSAVYGDKARALITRALADVQAT